MNHSEEIIKIKNSFEELKTSLKSLEEIDYEKKQYKTATRFNKEYEKLCNVLTDIEVKSYFEASEYSAEMSGIWGEENKALIDRYNLKGLFSDEHWVFIVVDLIAQKIARQPLKIYKKTIDSNKKTIIEEAPNHPYNKVLEEPNEYHSYTEWMYCNIVDLILMGENYIWGGVNFDRLYHIPSETIEPFVGSDGKIISYQQFSSLDNFNTFTRNNAYPVSEMIPVLRPHPSSVYRGFSPFLPTRKSILFNRLTSEYLNNFYLKGAVGGVFLELDVNQNFANIQRLIRTYEQAYSGRKAQRRTKVLPPGVKVNNVSETLAEQSLKEFLDSNKSDIIAILKVPPHEVGLQKAGSLGSEEYITALKNFYETTIIPTMRLEENKLTKRLKGKIGEEYFIKFDISDVEVLKENELKKAQLSKELLYTHKLNEVRQTVYNLPADPEGEVFVYAKPASPFSIPSSFSLGANQIEEKSETSPVVQVSKPSIITFEKSADNLIKASGDWFNRRKKAIDEIIKDPMKDSQKFFLNMFADQGIEILRRLSKMTKSIDLRDEEKIKKEIMGAIAKVRKTYEPKYSDNYRALLEKMSALTFDHPYYAAEQEIVDKISKSSKNELLRFLDKRSEYVFDQLGITDLKMALRIIQAGAKNSDSIGQMANEISKTYNSPTMMGYRADRIARTEMLTVLSQASNVATKKASAYFPNLRKMWISTNDDRTRGNPSGRYPIPKKGPYADHWHMHGMIVGNDESFYDSKNNDTLAYPRDPRGKPNSVINCRCTTIVLPAEEMAKFQDESEARPNA